MRGATIKNVIVHLHIVIIIFLLNIMQGLGLMKIFSGKKGRRSIIRKYTAPSFRHQMRRGSGSIIAQKNTIHERTGFYPEEFAKLFEEIWPQLIQPRLATGGKRQRIIKTSLEPHMRLLLALEYLKGELSLLTTLH
jgi:hypothetical protein